MDDAPLEYSIGTSQSPIVEWFTKREIREKIILSKYEFAVVKYDN